MTWENDGGQLKSLDPCTHMGGPEEASAFRQAQLQPLWRMNQIMEDLFPYQSAFQIKINLKNYICF